MPGHTRGLSLRSFAPGDEVAIARLFNDYLQPFLGPSPATPESWLAQYDVHWRTPILSQQPECCRVAEREGEIVGYAVTDCPADPAAQTAILQELCVADLLDADEIAALLVSDAERLTHAAGKRAIHMDLSHEDGLARQIAQSHGYCFPGDGTGVFMVTIINLLALFREIEEELSARFAESGRSRWEGVVHFRSGDLEAALRFAGGAVRAEAANSDPDFSVDISPETLPLLLFGRISVREAFLQACLSVPGPDRPSALALLDCLFPCLPLYLPRSQWW
jgi:putative sterol carrier protein